MHITRTMLHPELRAAGTAIRALWPAFSEGKFRFCNTILDIFCKGRARTRKLHYEQVDIDRADGSHLRLCVYTPKAPCTGGAPGLLWLHGGGYAMGVPEQDARFAERFIETVPCAVVMPDYRRSMRAPFPAALRDCYLALLWLRDHAVELGVRPDQLFVGGDSAGGGLCAALTLYARDLGEVALAFQMPLYPMLDDRMTAPSAQDNDAPVWNSRSNEAAWRLYLGAAYGTDGVSKYAAPARETDFRGLPPLLTYVGSVEPFRDETVRFVEALSAAGAPVRFREFPGCFHAFDVVCGGTKIAKEAEAFLLSGFRYAAAHFRKAQPESGVAPQSDAT